MDAVRNVLSTLYNDGNGQVNVLGPVLQPSAGNITCLICTEEFNQGFSCQGCLGEFCLPCIIFGTTLCRYNQGLVHTCKCACTCLQQGLLPPVPESDVDSGYSDVEEESDEEEEAEPMEIGEDQAEPMEIV